MGFLVCEAMMCDLLSVTAVERRFLKKSLEPEIAMGRYSRKASITKPLEGSMDLNRGHFRERPLFRQLVESSEC